MAILHRLLRKYGSCSCVTFSLINPAYADDPTLIDSVQNLVRFRDLKASGQVNEADAKKAAEALDQVGTSMSIHAATIVARGNAVAGLPSAAAGSALFPIAESIGERLGKLTSVQGRLDKALASGDSSQMEALIKEQASLTAGASTWKANYGSSAETISRVSEGVNLNSSNSLVSGIESIAKRLAKTFVDVDGTSNSASVTAPSPQEKTSEKQRDNTAYVPPNNNLTDTPAMQSNDQKNGLRLAGSYGLEDGQLRYTDHPETAENSCMEIDGPLIQFAKNMRGGDSPLCVKLKEEEDEMHYSYFGQCKIFGVNGFTGRWSKGLFEAKVTPENGIETTWSVQDWDQGALQLTARQVFASCEYVEPDCSPAGQAAWKAKNGGGPTIFCENPL